VIVVDTTVWVDYFNATVTPQTLWLDRSLATQQIGIVDLVLCEVLQGIRSPREFQLVREQLLRLPGITAGGIDVAMAAATNYQSLRRRGITIRKTIDCLIATVCIQAGHTLLHNDRDFDPFERYFGLKVVHA
jgi:predicted nucleic acid-binding protein